MTAADAGRPAPGSGAVDLETEIEEQAEEVGAAAAAEAPTLPEEVAGAGAEEAAGPDAAPATEAGPEKVPEKVAEKVAELTGDLQRLQAEFLNYKRRVDRDRDLVLQNARFSVLSALLPVLDDLDRAHEHGELVGGFRAVAESLERIVAGEGLVRFGAPGDEFDPRLHEALMHSLSPGVTTTTCDKVVQAGYRIGDRVVRPALVTVVDPAPAEEAGEAGAEAGARGPARDEWLDTEARPHLTTGDEPPPAGPPGAR